MKGKIRLIDIPSKPYPFKVAYLLRTNSSYENANDSTNKKRLTVIIKILLH